RYSETSAIVINRIHRRQHDLGIALADLADLALPYLGRRRQRPRRRPPGRLPPRLRDQQPTGAPPRSLDRAIRRISPDRPVAERSLHAPHVRLAERAASCFHRREPAGAGGLAGAADKG